MRASRQVFERVLSVAVVYLGACALVVAHAQDSPPAPGTPESSAAVAGESVAPSEPGGQASTGDAAASEANATNESGVPPLARPPKLNLQLIAPSGEVLANPAWPAQAEWVWSGSGLSRQPRLRVWVRVPANVRPQPVAAIEAQASTSAANTTPGAPPSTPPSTTPSNEQIAELDPTDQPFGSGARVVAFYADQLVVPIALRVAGAAPGKSRSVNLLVTTLFSPAPLVVDPRCAESGITPRAMVQQGRHFAAAISCFERDGVIGVKLLSALDAQITGVSGFGKRLDAQPNQPGSQAGAQSGDDASSRWSEERYAFRKPQDGVSIRRKIGTFSAKSREMPGSSQYMVFFEPRALGRRWSSSVGLVGSYLAYSEAAGGVQVAKVTQLGITGKASTTYQLIRARLDVGLSGFVTLLPLKLSTTPDSLPAARFYGINLRLGYRLPIELGAMDWGVALGYYFWGMLVSGDQYGLRQLAGPQLFLTLRKQQARKRGWFTYLKFAPISDSGSFGGSSYEAAVGGGFQLTSPQARRPIFATLDVSRLSFQSSQFENSAKLTTASLGLQLNF